MTLTHAIIAILVALILKSALDTVYLAIVRPGKWSRSRMDTYKIIAMYILSVTIGVATVFGVVWAW